MRRQEGVMLIEALVGILIFSIGILALIGMQGVAIKNTTDARYRSEAAFLASQIVSRMWVDRTNLASYADASCSGYASCQAWRTQVEATLPGVVLASNTLVPSIIVDAASGNQVTVTVFWLHPGGDQIRNVQFVNRINGGS